MVAVLYFALNPNFPRAEAVTPKLTFSINENVLHAPTQAEAKAWAFRAVKRHGWSTKQYVCLSSLWGKESAWRWNADQIGGTAYGIPQADPPSKMADIAKDWRINAATQMRWGLKYIKLRYETPCKALAVWKHRARHANGWY